MSCSRVLSNALEKPGAAYDARSALITKAPRQAKKSGKMGRNTFREEELARGLRLLEQRWVWEARLEALDAVLVYSVHPARQIRQVTERKA